MGEGNSDLISVHPELNCISSLRQCVRVLATEIFQKVSVASTRMRLICSEAVTLWHWDIVMMWHNSAVSLWHSDAVTQWSSDDVTLTQWPFDPVWHGDPLTMVCTISGPITLHGLPTHWLVGKRSWNYFIIFCLKSRVPLMWNCFELQRECGRERAILCKTILATTLKAYFPYYINIMVGTHVYHGIHNWLT